MRLPLEFQCETGLLLRVDGKVRIPFQKAGESTLMSISGAEKGFRLSCAGKLGVSETGMSGNFLSCIKGVKYLFKFHEGTWDFS